MTKRYYTTTKTGEEVEVDEALAKQLVAQGKKQPSDFQIEEDEITPSTQSVSSPSAYASEMRDRAKSDYEEEVRNLKNQETQEKYGMYFPRTVKAETFPQALGAAVLDASSLPGRAIAAGIGGLATGAGEKFIGNGEFLNPALEEAQQIMSRKGGNEYRGFIPQMAESIVKDPFLIPTLATGGIVGMSSKIPHFAEIAGKVLMKSPKLISTAGHGLAAGLENIIGGIAERGVDPSAKTFDKSEMITEGVLGGILGSAGHAGEEWLRGLGDTDIGRALIKKITPSKLEAGAGKKLAEMINEGYGETITRDKSELLDPKKLGKFLSEKSSQPDEFLPDSKYTRIPEWIETQKEKIGNEIGEKQRGLTGERIEITKDNFDDAMSVIPEIDQPNIMRTFRTNPDAIQTYEGRAPTLTELEDLIKAANKKTMIGKSGRENIVSQQEIQNFLNDVYDLLPTKSESYNPSTGLFDRIHDTQLDPIQLQQLNKFLYNAGKESSLKYHPSKEQFATELRKLISGIQSDILRKNYGPEAAKLPKQYAALADLDKYAKTSPILNPDRPSVFEGGIIKGIGRGTMGLASQIAESQPIRRWTKAGIQSAIRSPERTQNAPAEQARFYQSLSSADQRAFMRATEALRFNPNDPEALAILNSIRPKK